MRLSNDYSQVRIASKDWNAERFKKIDEAINTTLQGEERDSALKGMVNLTFSCGHQQNCRCSGPIPEVNVDSDCYDCLEDKGLIPPIDFDAIFSQKPGKWIPPEEL